MSTQPTTLHHVVLSLQDLNADEKARDALVTAVLNMAPKSALVTSNPVMQSEVTNLGKTYTDYTAARGVAAASAKQHKLNVAAQHAARIVNNKSIKLLKTLVENNAQSPDDVKSMAMTPLSEQRPAPAALLPPESIDVRVHKKGSGNVTASAHQSGGPRRRYAAEMSPNPIGPTTWVGLPGGGKSRKLSGPSGTSVWVRFALQRGQLQSDWSTPVLITFP